MRAKTLKLDTRSFFIFGFVILVGGCMNMSQHAVDKTAGLNGSFEVSEKELPVNWLLYTPNTVPDADFQIILDG